MSFEFTCPHCGHTTVVDGQYVDQTGPCGKCGEKVTISGSSLQPIQKGNANSILLPLVIVLALVFGLGTLGLVVAGVIAYRGAAVQAEMQMREAEIQILKAHAIEAQNEDAQAQLEARENAEAAKDAEASKEPLEDQESTSDTTSP